MSDSRSDSQVVFAETSDLAHKKIFPGLYAIAKHGMLTMSNIGAALFKLSLAYIRQCKVDNIKQSRGNDSLPTLDLLPHLGNKGANLKQMVRTRLVEHKIYIDQHGQDVPNVRK